MLPTFDNSERAAFNESIHKRDSTFKIKYFKLQGLGNTEKKEALFGVLPVLFETTSSGQTVEVPESAAIEDYLSKKFQLFGNDDYDEIRIRAFASSIQSLITFYFLRVAVVKDVNYKAVMMERFLTEATPHFVVTHERHLQANGQNGYYVGDKLSLADLKLTIAVSMLLALTADQFVSKEKTPAIWAVWENVNKIPSYVEWKNTESYQTVAEGNIRSLGF